MFLRRGADRTWALGRIPTGPVTRLDVVQTTRQAGNKIAQVGRLIELVECLTGEIDLGKTGVERVVVKQPVQLERVTHHAQVVRFAIGLELVSAMATPEIVPELVHPRGGLREVAPHEVVPGAERHHGVAASPEGAVADP